MAIRLREAFLWTSAMSPTAKPICNTKPHLQLVNTSNSTKLVENKNNGHKVNKKELKLEKNLNSQQGDMITNNTTFS